LADALRSGASGERVEWAVKMLGIYAIPSFLWAAWMKRGEPPQGRTPGVSQQGGDVGTSSTVASPPRLAAELEPETRVEERRFYCGRCDRLLSWDELVEVRECRESDWCGERFDATCSGPNCPECRSEDADKITDQGCPDCFEQADG
jgi:hypothetical protein